MPKTPKKNISRYLQDIKHPSVRPVLKTMATLPVKTLAAKKAKSNFPKKKTYPKIFAALTIIAILLCGIFIFGFLNFKNNFAGATKQISYHFIDAKNQLVNLNPGAAKNSFLRANQELESIKSEAKKFKIFEISQLIGLIAPGFGEIPQLFNDISGFNGLALKISDASEKLMSDGIRKTFNGQGEALIKDIESIKSDIKSLRNISVSLRNRALGIIAVNSSGIMQNIAGDDYLSADIEMARVEELLSGILAILKSPTERHIAVFFQNPSEMRPSGGFIGSYADVSIKNGNIVNFDVRDIYDPDGQLAVKVEPPKQLQSLTIGWGARDANWFFDFPTSAQKVLYFLENSKIYSERLTIFDGAIAINAELVKDILELTGPIEIPEYDLTINENNFLFEIQEEVRAGKDRKTGQPKKILQSIAPTLIKRIMSLDEKKQIALASKLRERTAKKDIQFYFKDNRIENFILNNSAGGAVFQLPAGFFGDYLAVVNTNIAGGKTDIFIKQKIDLLSSIDSSGHIKNNLRITREHEGDTQKQSWYREINQNFIRIFTATNAKLDAVSGNSIKIIKPEINYESAGYIKDPDLSKTEREQNGVEITNESEKTVFGTWFNVSPGKTKTLEMTYERDGAIPSDEKKYQFIFEKQSGVNTSLKVSIEAPPGFIWQESNNEIFVYETDYPDGRIIINLKLIKQ